MTTLTYYILILIPAWLLCSVTGYLLTRRWSRRKGFTWTQKDRAFILAMSIGLSPIFLVISLAHPILDWLDTLEDKPARW